MKKIYLSLIISLALLAPVVGFAQSDICGGPIVTCGNKITCPTGSDGSKSPCSGQCTLDDAFKMISRIYEFIVKCMATPLAILAIIAGSIMMLISAGNPAWFNKGKDIFLWAIIGLVLAYCSFLIIKFVLDTIGVRPEIYQEYIGS